MEEIENERGAGTVMQNMVKLIVSRQAYLTYAGKAPEGSASAGAETAAVAITIADGNGDAGDDDADFASIVATA